MVAHDCVSQSFEIWDGAPSPALDSAGRDRHSGMRSEETRGILGWRHEETPCLRDATQRWASPEGLLNRPRDLSPYSGEPSLSGRENTNTPLPRVAAYSSPGVSEAIAKVTTWQCSRPAFDRLFHVTPESVDW